MRVYYCELQKLYKKMSQTDDFAGCSGSKFAESAKPGQRFEDIDP